MAVLQFLVSSGSSIIDACSIGPYFNIYTFVADETLQCGGCFGAGLNCWACSILSAARSCANKPGFLPI
jgi:hypothetical protein